MLRKKPCQTQYPADFEVEYVVASRPPAKSHTVQTPGELWQAGQKVLAKRTFPTIPRADHPQAFSTIKTP